MSSAVSILVQRDFAGIGEAYREMLEHDLARRAAEALGTPPPELEQQFGEGYYAWVGALRRLEDRRAVNASLALCADWSDGLVALERARSEFAADHPGCPRCAAPLLAREDTYCWNCRSSWEKEEKK